MQEKLQNSSLHKQCCSVVVLYECETWPLTLRDVHRLRVFENRVLRRIFGPKRDEVVGDTNILSLIFRCVKRKYIHTI
jgi:hypothetical protein